VFYRLSKSHIGGCLWHSFDHQRGYHPDPFYGGVADIFRQPKYSYYMFMAQRSPIKQENRLYETGPMVYIAHEMTPFSPKDVTVYSNCDEVRLTYLDGGKTWTKPTVLLRGACHARQVGWHRAPMPVLIKNGRVMTDVQYGAWSEKVFCDAVLSAPADSDLLSAENWVCTELFDAREHIRPTPEKIWGGIEGNVIETSDGKIIDFLRFADKTALILNYDPENPEDEPKLDSVIDFPATASKFDIVFDDATKKYFAIVSYALDEPPTKRNLLSLICSEDLIKWDLCTHLIDRRDDDPKEVGFQYVDFFIEGEDILYLCRTAVNGANNFHNSNFTTFHRIKNFREVHQ
jgi:hypothetical protein